MNNTKVGHFPPAKRLGLITHAVIILMLAGVSTWGFLNITRAAVGPMFVSYLLAALLAFAPIPFFGAGPRRLGPAGEASLAGP